VAVLLNANARQVGGGVRRALARVLPPEDLFLSRSPMDCRRIVQGLLEGGHDVLLTGGGDGTFLCALNELLREARRTGAHPLPRALPRLGVLRLGTGNALAAHTGALRDVVAQVRATREGRVRTARRLELLEVEGLRTAFAGLGVDGRVLNDFLWVKRTLGRGPLLHRLVSGQLGYALAVALKTAPHALTHPLAVECEVRNGEEGPAWRLGPGGAAQGEPVPPGGLLFRGPLTFAAAATMPFYGYGMRMFPFAGARAGHLHLRLAQVGALDVLTHLPQLWAGTWAGPAIHDFHVRGATLRFASPMPFQVGGDAHGERTEVRLQAAPESVEVLDYRDALPARR
jgi:diacylglycerol kinase family enzyme